MTLLRLLILSLIVLLTAPPAFAREQGQMAFLLQAESPPQGVVFEIVDHDEQSLAWALPRVREHIARLHQHFPQLPIAIVSHGNEQFGLLKKHRSDLLDIHRLGQQLVDEQVAIHVCSTHAQIAGFSAADFPEFVELSMQGPARVAKYLRAGYVLVNIERSPD